MKIPHTHITQNFFMFLFYFIELNKNKRYYNCGITELVEHAWDPMCVRACIRLRQLMVRAATQPGCAPALEKVAIAVKAKLSAALNGDVFLPALPPQ